eukprot:363393-Chlamydomonas_euryale.AAC.9
MPALCGGPHFLRLTCLRRAKERVSGAVDITGMEALYSDLVNFHGEEAVDLPALPLPLPALPLLLPALPLPLPALPLLLPILPLPLPALLLLLPALPLPLPIAPLPLPALLLALLFVLLAVG